MPRTAHAITRAKTTYGPSNIIVFDTETWHGKRAKVSGGEYHTLRLGCAIAYRLESGTRTRQRRITFADVNSFWDFVEIHQSDRNPLWLVAHNLPYDAGITDIWRRFITGGYEAEKFALTNTLSFIHGRWHGKPLNLLDTVNYWKSSLEEVGKAIGIPKMPMPDQKESDAVWQRYCSNDVDVTAAALDTLIAFGKEHDLGPWGPSIASLAMNAFRHKFMKPRSIFIHTHDDTLAIERGAYFGGITECNRIGRIKGPIHELDVNSMYPSQCLRSVPIKRVDHRPSPSVRYLESRVGGNMLFADVTLSTDSLRYPLRTATGTIYPQGTYRTCLPDPELCEALAAGLVKTCHGMAEYESAPALADYMRFFSDMKDRYGAEDNQAFRTLCKYYLNSLYGKFGQKTHRWMQWGKEALQKVERDHNLPVGTLKVHYDWPPSMETMNDVWEELDYGISLEVRDYFGFPEVCIGEMESRDSFPAISATITSYARVFLRLIQQECGHRNWYYSDTDSIWVNDVGMARLQSAGFLGTSGIGCLEYKGTVPWMMIYGPKDYETPEYSKLKGIKLYKSGQAPVGSYPVRVNFGKHERYYHRTLDGGYNQTQFPSAMRQISDQRWGGVFVRHLVKRLSRLQTKWKVDPEGWTRPLHYPEEAI